MFCRDLASGQFKRGGVAILASSQDTYWQEDDTLEKAFFAAVFEDRISRLGEVVEKAKDRYLAYYGPSSETLQYFEQYNLLGDPSMGLVVLDGTSTSDLVRATRDLPDECLMTNELLEVRLDVWVTNPPPSALIVKEKMPTRWTVTNATWNGNPMAPTYATGEYKWLFGVGTPVGSGTLRYNTRALGTTGEVYVITGTLLYGSTTVSTLGDQEIRLCATIDTDGDGMPDSWELQYGMNPTNNTDASKDKDSDGMINLEEYLADTNPTNDESRLIITDIGITGNQVQVTWRGGMAAIQYMERCADLASTVLTWQVIHIDEPPTPATNFFTESGATNRSMFYRIKAGR